MSEQTVHHFTDAELRAAIEEHVQPIEKKAFEAGKRAERAEAVVRLREELMLKVARASGLLPADSTGAVKGKSPEELAKRANELQLEALQEGRELGSIEAVQAAYTEAGIPWK